MSWRTIYISNTAKLDYNAGYMVVRKKDDITKIYIGEIGTVIIESTAVSLTTALLCELIKNKVKVIFCDEKHNPSSELVSYYGSHDTSGKIREQIKFDDYVKKEIWTSIVKRKILNQKILLEYYHKNDEAKLLSSYIEELQFYDETNREGHAAKVYFNALFGKSFTRDDDNSINAMLNYGYGIILSIISREIVSLGYITQLGIFHNNLFNQFNLSSDLIEPWRFFVDKFVAEKNPIKFDKDDKVDIISILKENTIIDNKIQLLENAIKIYVRSIFDALNEKDISLIKYCKYEL